MAAKLVLAVALLCLGGVLAKKECGECDRDACAKPDCGVEIRMPDECGCCEVCARLEDQTCGGKDWSEGRCASGYHCSVNPDEEGEERRGKCYCKYPYRVCGSDGNDYTTYCNLRFASWSSKNMGGSKIHKVHKGYCKFAPIIATPPTPIRNTTGSSVFMSCEVRAHPTARITWKFRKDEDAEPVDLPGDASNVACSYRGGPEKNEVTGWVLIEPLQKENVGFYECYAENEFGDDSSTATVEVEEEEL
ncbi:insulin-like growth factor-binding protein-like 1 [Branchiostoma floridae x Branchiostoma japonicum]